VEASEIEGAILENFGELPSSYIPRVTGTAKGQDRLGVINDFAAYTAKTPFQVMVIDTGDIWADSSDDDLSRAVRKAEIRTDSEFVKSRIFCVVLHKKHYDLGVVRYDGLIQAVFAAGVEWEAAQALILAFVRSKSPPRGGKRGDLCPRWVPPAPVTAPSTLLVSTHARAREKDNASPPPSLSSALSPVASVFVPSFVVGDEKYITQSVGVPKHTKQACKRCLYVSLGLGLNLP